MKLLRNTVLQHRNQQVKYEILHLEQMLLFKPWFYHHEQDFPCIVVSRLALGWQFDETVDKQIERQIREDIASLTFIA